MSANKSENAGSGEPDYALRRKAWIGVFVISGLFWCAVALVLWSIFS
nr:YmiA family putative membrane protein [Entomohabitans teleogrylli]